jgi:hypothetical protein
MFCASQPEACFVRGGGGQAEFTKNCDLTASSAARCAGIDSNMSRATWIAIKRGELPQEVPDPLMRMIMDNGTNEQPLAMLEYCLTKLWDAEKHSLVPEWRFTRFVYDYRASEVYRLGATPDSIVLRDRETKIAHLLEIKTLQLGDHNNDDSRRAQADASHILQVLVQLFCTGLQEAHLFYYRRHTGFKRCFKITSNDELFIKHVLPVLLPGLRNTRERRMPTGSRASITNMLQSRLFCNERLL